MSERYDRTHAKRIVLHHLGDGIGPAQTVEELASRANPYHYQFPDYDFGIIASGQIVALRPLTYIGAHAQANKGDYMYGNNWWNKCSISIVTANDNTKFAPPAAMVEGTIECLLNLCKDPKHLVPVEDVYLHSQIFTTDCPGAKYSPLSLNNGYLDFDYIRGKLHDRLPKAPLHEAREITAKVLGLRSEAKHDAVPTILLHKGDIVQILTKQPDGWYKVAAGKHTGFVYFEFLD